MSTKARSSARRHPEPSGVTVDADTQRVIDFLVPPPRSRRWMAITTALIVGPLVAGAWAGLAGVFSPRVEQFSERSTVDAATKTIHFTVALTNSGQVGADVDSYLLRWNGLEMASRPPFPHVHGGSTASLQIELRVTDCGQARADALGQLGTLALFVSPPFGPAQREPVGVPLLRPSIDELCPQG